MSRSYKKPYNGNCEGSKEWKKNANQKIRRNVDLDIANGNQYKKLEDVWASPMENKHGYWDVPKMRRK
jgi:hypothetical protein